MKLIRSISLVLLCIAFVPSLALGQEKKPGDVLWSFPVFSINPSSPTIDNNNIYFAEGRDLFSINRNGGIKWRKNNIDIDSYTAAPAITIEDNIFVRLRSNRQGIYSFNPSGIIEWYMINNYKFKSNPAMSYNGDIYIIGQKQGMNLDRENGLVSIGLNKEVKWEFHKSNITISGNPAVGLNDVIYVFGRDVIQGINRLYAINQEGEEIWGYETEDIKSTSFAIDKNSTIYFGAKNKLYAINKLGEMNWVFHNTAAITSSPAIGHDGAIYFGSGSELVSINGDGTKRWAYKSYGIIESSPAIDNGNIIYFGTKKKVFAINEAGKKEWEVELAADIFWPDGIKTSPAIDNDGTLFIGANKLYAIKTSSSGPANSAWPMLGQNSRRTYSISTPVIIEGPKSLVVLKEQKANFEVKFKGTEPLSYQWYKNDIAIDGETNYRLQLDNVEEADEGRYSVKVQNIFGESLSEKANLIVPESDTIILIDDEYVKEESSGVDKVKIEIKSNIQENEIFYTLDGSKPSFTSTPYTTPFQLAESATIRAIAYSFDFTESVEAEPVSFRILTTYSLNVSGTGGGTVTIDPPNGPYLEGAEVTLTATPEGDWDFIGWSGDYTSSDSTITVTMNGAKMLKPTFGTNVTVNEIGAGKVIQTPPNPVPYGSSVTFTAKPDTGHYFFRWAGEKTGNGNPTQLQITKPKPIISCLFADISLMDPGQKIWAFETGNSVHSSPAIGNDGTVYVGSRDSNLYAINPDGSKKWEFNAQGRVNSSPAIGSDGTVYIGSYDNKVYALNQNGTKKWEFATGDKVLSSPAIGSDGTIYVGASDQKLYAINPDGSKKWEFETGRVGISEKGHVESSPAIGSDGTIYVGSNDGNLYAINPDGTKKWEFETGRMVKSSPAIGSDGTIYVGSWDYKFYAINPDGTKKWAFETGDNVHSSPAIGSDGTIYVGSWDNNLYAINPDGTKKWAFETGDNVHPSPAIGSDGIIYVGSDDRKLYALKISSNGPADSPWPMFGRNAQRTSALPQKPLITLQPKDQIVTIGSRVEFTVEATGKEPLNYQWYKAGKAIDGAKESNLIIAAVKVDDLSKYYVRVKNSEGTATSDTSTLSLPTRITLQPESQHIILGKTASFFVEATGMEPLEYQWYKDRLEIKGATQGYYSVLNVSLSDYGDYSVQVRSASGNVMSEIAKLIQLEVPPTIILQPKDQYVVIGHNIEFVVEATGTEPLDYQWYKDGKLIKGANKNRYVRALIMGSDLGGYSVMVKNNAGSIMSKIAELTALEALGKRWEFKTGGALYSSPAIGGDGTIYVGSDDNKVYALNPDGTKKWDFETRDWVRSSPAIGSDGTIYVGSYDHRVYALNPDGTKKWEFQARDWVRSSPAIGSDGTIYVGSYDARVYALNPDGTEKWKSFTGNAVWSSPAIGSDGTVYVGSLDNKVYALKSNWGIKKWEFETHDRVLSSPAIGSDGTIYVGARDNFLYSINPDGTKKWEFETGGWVISSPAIGSDGTVYVGSYDNNLYAINPDGTKKWEFKTGNGVAASPVIGSDDTVYFGSFDRKVYAVIGNTGVKRWEFNTFEPGGAEGIIHSSPAVGRDGTVYVGSGNGIIYALYSLRADRENSPWPMFGRNAQRTGRAPIEIKLTNPNTAVYPFTFTFSTEKGWTYEVQASDDLKEWSKLGEVQGKSGEVEFTDPRLPKVPYKRNYFRVKLVE